MVRNAVVAILLALSAIVAGPVQAEWMQATTRHFVVYSDSREAELRDLATELETFDSVIRYYHGTADTTESASNRLTVYVLPNASAVQKLCGKCPNILGFYNPRATGSVAFTPRRAGFGGKTDLGPRIVLFHEYAHHFLLGNYANAYPAWYSEGYAEFVSTFEERKAGYLIGAPAMHRAIGLFNTHTPATALFDPLSRKRMTAQQVEGVYGRGWLLTHYLMIDAGRRAQLSRYLTLLNTGTPSLKAATEVFGDLKTLDKQLDRYRDAKSIAVVPIARTRITAPSVALRTLTAGEAAMIDARIVSTRGVNAAQARTLYRDALPIATAHPADSEAQSWFAEIAFDANENVAAEAAADRALAIDAKNAQALLYKARVRFRALGDTADEKAWADARRFVVRANRLDPDNAAPLVQFYDSFGLEGRPPTASANAGLYRAQQLVPQDPGVRMRAARQRIIDGELVAARTLLRPLAFNPHAAPDNAVATLLAALDGGGDAKAALATFDAAGASPD